MGTRAGDVDAGVVLHLIRQKGSVDEVERLLQRESGLLGLAGSSDIRVLLAEEAQGNARARAALDARGDPLVHLPIGKVLTMTPCPYKEGS